MSCLSRPIRNRDDISFVFSLVHFFDQKEVQSDFALKRDEAFRDYGNFCCIDQKGSSDVGDLKLVTIFGCWGQNFAGSYLVLRSHLVVLESL